MSLVVMQTKEVTSVIVRAFLVVASLTYLYNVFHFLSDRDIPPGTTPPTTYYSDRFQDRANPDGQMPNLRILGVAHTLRAFLLDREHILNRLREADIVLLERYQDTDYPSIGEGTPKENDYFLAVAAWAIEHGKAAYFIDTRVGVVSTILLQLGLVSAALILCGTFLLAIWGWRAWRFPIILCVVGLSAGLVSVPGIAVTLVHGLNLANATALPIMSLLDYSPITDGFSIQLGEREAAFARDFPEKRIVVVIGNSHAVVADYYNQHPRLARFKRFFASLWPDAPITEVRATEVPHKFIWRIPEQFDSVGPK